MTQIPIHFHCEDCKRRTTRKPEFQALYGMKWCTPCRKKREEAAGARVVKWGAWPTLRTQSGEVVTSIDVARIMSLLRGFGVDQADIEGVGVVCKCGNCGTRVDVTGGGICPACKVRPTIRAHVQAFDAGSELLRSLPPLLETTRFEDTPKTSRFSPVVEGGGPRMRDTGFHPAEWQRDFSRKDPALQALRTGPLPGEPKPTATEEATGSMRVVCQHHDVLQDTGGLAVRAAGDAVEVVLGQGAYELSRTLQKLNPGNRACCQDAQVVVAVKHTSAAFSHSQKNLEERLEATQEELRKQAAMRESNPDPQTLANLRHEVANLEAQVEREGKRVVTLVEQLRDEDLRRRQAEDRALAFATQEERYRKKFEESDKLLHDAMEMVSTQRHEISRLNAHGGAQSLATMASQMTGKDNLIETLKAEILSLRGRLQQPDPDPLDDAPSSKEGDAVAAFLDSLDGLVIAVHQAARPDDVGQLLMMEGMTRANEESDPMDATLVRRAVIALAKCLP